MQIQVDFRKYGKAVAVVAADIRRLGQNAAGNRDGRTSDGNPCGIARNAKQFLTHAAVAIAMLATPLTTAMPARAATEATYGVTLTGHVTLPDGGLPVPAGTYVWLHEPDADHYLDFDIDTHGRSTVDPATGAFSFANVSPGNYVLRAVPPNAPPYEIAPSNIVPAHVFTAALALPDLALSTPAVTGTVFAPDGLTASRGIVHVFRGVVEVERRWSDTGGFAVGGLRPGLYSLRAEPWPDDLFAGSPPISVSVNPATFESRRRGPLLIFSSRSA